MSALHEIKFVVMIMDNLQVVQLLLEGMFAIIMAGIGYTIKSLAADIRELTRVTTDLRISQSRDYVTKEDWLLVRSSIHDLRDEMNKLRLVMAAEQEAIKHLVSEGG